METLLPAGVEEWITKGLALWGLIVTVVSFVASKVNRALRTAADGGLELPAWLLRAGVWLNWIAVNFDKSEQLASGYRGPSAPPAPPTLAR